MSLSFQRSRLRSFTTSLVSRLLAFFILSSFAVTLLPIVNTSAKDSMPCCAGKSSGHCDSGLAKPKPRPVITEPMCGLTPVDIQSSAETTSQNVDAESNSSHVAADSISKHCQMDCGACATVTSRHKRQKGLIIARITRQTPATVINRFDNTTSFYSSNESWTRINPRGPPAVL